MSKLQEIVNFFHQFGDDDTLTVIELKEDGVLFIWVSEPNKGKRRNFLMSYEKFENIHILALKNHLNVQDKKYRDE